MKVFPNSYNRSIHVLIALCNCRRSYLGDDAFKSDTDTEVCEFLLSSQLYIYIYVYSQYIFLEEEENLGNQIDAKTRVIKERENVKLCLCSNTYINMLERKK